MTSIMGGRGGPARDFLEPYEKSLIRGSYFLARRAKTRELAKKQALRMFVGWGKKSGKEGSEARVQEVGAYLDELVAAERQV